MGISSLLLLGSAVYVRMSCALDMPKVELNPSLAVMKVSRYFTTCLMRMNIIDFTLTAGQAGMPSSHQITFWGRPDFHFMRQKFCVLSQQYVYLNNGWMTGCGAKYNTVPLVCIGRTSYCASITFTENFDPHSTLLFSLSSYIINLQLVPNQ